MPKYLLGFTMVLGLSCPAYGGLPPDIHQLLIQNFTLFYPKKETLELQAACRHTRAQYKRGTAFLFLYLFLYNFPYAFRWIELAADQDTRLALIRASHSTLLTSWLHPTPSLMAEHSPGLREAPLCLGDIYKKGLLPLSSPLLPDHTKALKHLED